MPEPSVRLNKAVTCYGLLAMGLGAGMLMNVAVLEHGARLVQRPAGRAHRRDAVGGLKAFLEARDGGFRPEPFGPRVGPEVLM